MRQFPPAWYCKSLAPSELFCNCYLAFSPENFCESWQRRAWGLEAQQQYCSYRMILAALLLQNWLVFVFVGYRKIVARYVAKWGIPQMCLCKTGIAKVLGAPNLPEKVPRDFGYRCDSIAMSSDMGPKAWGMASKSGGIFWLIFSDLRFPGCRRRGCNSLILRLFAFVCVCSRLRAFTCVFGPFS